MRDEQARARAFARRSILTQEIIVRLVITTFLAAGAISIAACEQSPTEQRADNVEEAAENRAERVEEQAENRAEEIREAGENEAEAVRNTDAE